MSNNIQVSVTFLCEDNRLQEILEFIQCDYVGDDSEHGIGTIDFNKIVPMPESLDIESGSKTDEGIQLYLTAINPAADYYGTEKFSLSKFQKLMENERFQKVVPLTPEQIENLRSKWSMDELLSYGKICVNNICDYGAPTWYQWCCKNWGTKWNAYDFHYTPGSHTISFTTANDIPDPVFEKLSTLYEDVEIGLSWGGYWAGGCGEVRFKNGDCILDEFYDYYDITIDIPAALGYKHDYYGLCFVPEQFGVSRNNFPDVATCALRFAIEEAPSKTGAETLLNDKAAFNQAIAVAIESGERHREESLRRQMEYLETCKREQSQTKVDEATSVPETITPEEIVPFQLRNRYGIPATSPVPKS